MARKMYYPSVRLRSAPSGKLSGTFRLYVDISWPGGGREKRSLNIRTEQDPFKKGVKLSALDRIKFEDAKMEAYRVEMEIRAEFLGKPINRPIPAIDFIEHLGKVQVRSAKQLVNYLSVFQKTILLPQITPSFLERFKDFLEKDTELSPNSRRAYWNVLKAEYNKLRVIHQIKDSPFEFVKNPGKIKTTRDYLDTDELSRFIQAGMKINEPATIGFLFMIVSGLRISDLVSLTGAELRSGRKQTKKTKDWANLPKPDGPFAWLLDKIGDVPDKDFVFKFSASTMRICLKKICQAAGISKNITPHAARYTAFRMYSLAGVGSGVISKLLTHTSLGTTNVYARTANDDILAAHQKLLEVWPDLKK